MHGVPKALASGRAVFAVLVMAVLPLSSCEILQDAFGLRYYTVKVSNTDSHAYRLHLVSSNGDGSETDSRTFDIPAGSPEVPTFGSYQVSGLTPDQHELNLLDVEVLAASSKKGANGKTLGDREYEAFMLSDSAELGQFTPVEVKIFKVSGQKNVTIQFTP